MNLALNDLQRLIYHKTQTTNLTNLLSPPTKQLCFEATNDKKQL